jgi:UDP-N-acetylglucosamine--N-acetylmuramyl-(pentapeptide) pyrophosphoryl-undecaprenol N-acetylglucosamine transferase
MSYNKRIILISSSTGGHALPVLDLYKELKNNLAEPIIFHSGSLIENELFKGLSAYKITTGKLHRRFSILNLMEGLKLIFGFIQSFFLLLFLWPKVVFSKGGFCGVPVLFVARLFRRPIFIHESDSVIGLTNRMFLNKSKKVFLSFPLNLYSENLPSSVEYSGLIVRKSFITNKKKPSKQNEKPLIFVTGGSQGAIFINGIIFEILPTLLKKYDVVHQVGNRDFDVAKEVSSKLDPNENGYKYFSFSLEKGEDAIRKADLTICRSGANTLGELSVLSKAAILIPYRYASGDHQLKNARFFEKVNAAILIREENLTGKSLIDRIEYLFSDVKNLETLGRNCQKAIKHDGLSEISREIVNYMKG